MKEIEDSEASDKGASKESTAPQLSDDQKRVLAVLRNTKAFADMISILMLSHSHKHLFLADLEWMLLPPLGLRQYRIFTDGKRTVGYAVWATLSEEVEKELIQRGTRLRPVEWNSGNRLWLIDLVGIETNKSKLHEQFLSDLLKGPFKGQSFKAFGVDPKTNARRVVQMTMQSKSKDLSEFTDEFVSQTIM